MRGSLARAVLLGGLFLTGTAVAQNPVPYDIVYVRQPRYGDTVKADFPDVLDPALAEPGADLMLLHPDGTEEVLVDCTVDAVTDPFLSFDAQWVYYARYHDLTDLSSYHSLPRQGSDIYRIHLATRKVERLTHGEFTPNTGAGNWDESNPVNPGPGYNALTYGVLNLGPCPLPGGRVAFVSNRNGLVPPKTFTRITLQLYVMDEDGRNVTAIAPMTIGSAMHPTPLRDGRLMFSTYETQGLRDRRMWGIWTIHPDGTNWGPLLSAFRQPQAFHFQTQLSDEDLIVVDYYNGNNAGFGAMLRFPVRQPPGTPFFNGAFPGQNPPILETTFDGLPTSFTMPFTPVGTVSLMPYSHARDRVSPPGGPVGNGVGKATHPSAAPGNDLLISYTFGPANDRTMPFYDSGLYLVPGGNIIQDPTDPAQLVLIKNDPAYNEAWPRAVVPYRDVHGVDEPMELPWLPNDGQVHPELPAGTPHGLIGSSSVIKRQTFPGTGVASFGGLDPFNTSQNGASSNWVVQGADAGQYFPASIWGLRLIALEPNSHRAVGPNSGSHFFQHSNERHRILGEIPLRKYDVNGNPILDDEGNPDTSFLVKVPADTPFTFQTIGPNGATLNMAQTWHQVRPGEMRTNCGGCHAHSQAPLDFDTTAASLPAHPIYDLSKETPLLTYDAQGKLTVKIVNSPYVDVEFLQDIRPILQQNCVSCHTTGDPDPPGALVLDDLSLYNGLPGDYKRLADDSLAQWGYPPVISNQQWRGTNASRYIRKFQSRRSLLAWKVFGFRADGWFNSDHPTETVPGDPNTLPPGTNPDDADLDYTGTIMPPPSSGLTLTPDQRITIARWIDLGAPIDTGTLTGNPAHGWFLDDLRPTLTVSQPRPGRNPRLDVIRIGVADAKSGVDLSTLSVIANFDVNGQPAGTELAPFTILENDGVYAIYLTTPIRILRDGNVKVEIADQQGNVTRVDRSFSVFPGRALK